MKHVTIKDIAKKLNISPSTVSRALHDHPDIHDNTKKRVHQLAKQLNDAVKAQIGSGELDEAMSILLWFGVNAEDAEEIIAEGPIIFMDDYPINKDQVRSILRSAPKPSDVGFGSEP